MIASMFISTLIHYFVVGMWLCAMVPVDLSGFSYSYYRPRYGLLMVSITEVVLRYETIGTFVHF